MSRRRKANQQRHQPAQRSDGSRSHLRTFVLPVASAVVAALAAALVARVLPPTSSAPASPARPARPVRPAPSRREPVALVVNTNPAAIPGFSDEGVTGVLPAGAQTRTIPSAGCNDFESWLGHVGGVDADHTRLQVIAQGLTSEPVLISDLRVTKTRVGPPLTGTGVTCPPGSAAQVRAVFVDLDHTPARVRVGAGVRPFGFTLRRGETETFDVDATTTHADVRWTMALDLVIAGRRRTIAIDDDGRPFETTPLPPGPVWRWDVQSGTWTSGSENVPGGRPFPPRT